MAVDLVGGCRVSAMREGTPDVVGSLSIWKQVGKATTTTWSPVLKKMIALATIDRPHYADGTTLDLELTVEAVRHRVPVKVARTPFFNPARKTATPPA